MSRAGDRVVVGSGVAPAWRHQEGPACFREFLALEPGSTVALMGAGGKHTLMARLQWELTAAGVPALLTSSTNLHRPASRREPELFAVQHDNGWRREVRNRLEQRKAVYLLQRSLGNGLLKGISVDLLHELRRDHPDAVIVVKADGARKRCFKAPGPNEPVIPPFADTCVVIVGIDCIGEALTEQHVHRPEVVARLAGCEWGTPITAQTVARVLSHRESYPGRLPEAARRVVYLSKVVTAPQYALAAEVIGELHPGAYTKIGAGDTPEGRAAVWERP